MSTKMGRAEYLKSHPRASAWAELADATNEQLRITPGPVKLEEGSFAGQAGAHSRRRRRRADDSL